MNRRKLAKLLVGALLLAGSVVIARERSALARVRVEHEELLGERQEAAQLREENAQLEALRVTNIQIKQLEHDNRDLPKLRNDVRQLREQAAEAASLRADNARLTDALNRKVPPKADDPIPPDFIPRAGLRDLGLGTPESAVQTYLNAICNADVHRAEECQRGTLEMARNHYQRSPEDLARERQSLLDQSASFTGYRIVNQRQLGPDQAEIDVQGAAGGAILPLHLNLRGYEWTVHP